MSADDEDDIGPITPEFIAHINSGFGRPYPISYKETRKGIKKTREDVTSRSRAEIIDWVLGSEDLIRVCICPYCLKIHSRRDNTRVHMKNHHPEKEPRDFQKGRDATLEEVRRVNDIGKCEFRVFEILGENTVIQFTYKNPKKTVYQRDLQHVAFVL